MIMPKQDPAEVEDRAVRMVLDHQGNHPSLRGACVAVSDHLGVFRASLQCWLIKLRLTLALAVLSTRAAFSVSTAEDVEMALFVPGRASPTQCRASCWFVARLPLR